MQQQARKIFPDQKGRPARDPPAKSPPLLPSSADLDPEVPPVVENGVMLEAAAAAVLDLPLPLDLPLLPPPPMATQVEDAPWFKMETECIPMQEDCKVLGIRARLTTDSTFVPVDTVDVTVVIGRSSDGDHEHDLAGVKSFLEEIRPYVHAVRVVDVEYGAGSSLQEATRRAAADMAKFRGPFVRRGLLWVLIFPDFRIAESGAIDVACLDLVSVPLHVSFHVVAWEGSTIPRLLVRSMVDNRGHVYQTDCVKGAQHALNAALDVACRTIAVSVRLQTSARYVVQCGSATCFHNSIRNQFDIRDLGVEDAFVILHSGSSDSVVPGFPVEVTVECISLRDSVPCIETPWRPLPLDNGQANFAIRRTGVRYFAILAMVAVSRLACVGCAVHGYSAWFTLWHMCKRADPAAVQMLASLLGIEPSFDTVMDHLLEILLHAPPLAVLNMVLTWLHAKPCFSLD